MDAKLIRRVKVLISNAIIERTPTYVMEDGSTSNEVYKKEFYDSSKWELHDKQTILLLKLYQQLGSKERKALIPLLSEYLGKNYSAHEIIVITLTFIHTGNFEHFFKAILSEFTSHTKTRCLWSINTLARALKYKSSLFSEEEIQRIYDWCQDYFDGKNKLGQEMQSHPSLYREVTKELRALLRLCNIILTQHFAQQIENAFNPELNLDQEKVKEAMHELGFPLDLTESLKHIDNLLEKADEPMKYRDVMSAVRAFIERLFETVAKELDPKTKIDGKDSKKVAGFFQSQGLISSDMRDLLISLRHYLSNDGTHKLKSSSEDARIAKNMTIELSLYLLTRLREFEERKT